MPHLPQLPAPTARRLVADYRQLQREPLSTCAAAPDGDDLRRWRLSLTCSEGPHSGTIFHGDMSFPDNYPNDPPTIKLCTQLAHPNVFEGTDYNQHTYNQPGFFI
jgi:ubiquitin-protein ligase